MATAIFLPASTWLQHAGCLHAAATSADVNLGFFSHRVGLHIGYHSAHHTRPRASGLASIRELQCGPSGSMYASVSTYVCRAEMLGMVEPNPVGSACAQLTKKWPLVRVRLGVSAPQSGPGAVACPGLKFSAPGCTPIVM